MQCTCGRTIDTTNRVTGDMVLCGCGQTVRVVHRAVVMGERLAPPPVGLLSRLQALISDLEDLGSRYHKNPRPVSVGHGDGLHEAAAKLRQILREETAIEQAFKDSGYTKITLRLTKESTARLQAYRDRHEDYEALAEMNPPYLTLEEAALQALLVEIRR